MANGQSAIANLLGTVNANGALLVTLDGGTGSATTMTVDTLTFNNANPDVSLSRGATDVLLLASGDSMAFGGVAAGNVRLKPNGTALQVRLGDDSGYGDLVIRTFNFNGAIAGPGGEVLFSRTAPTISSGFGTSPSVVANNGTAGFTINVGTGGTASAGVIGLPTAANGWIVNVQNLTAQAANRASVRTTQTASSTTSATIQNQNVATGAATAWTASDVLLISAVGY